MSVKIVGIGAGPSNLSLAALLQDPKIQAETNSSFYDQKLEPSWHSNQILSGTDLQNEWYRDLVTPASPTNEFSFLNYLHRKGRLMRFINAGYTAPSRAEFEDYLSEAAKRLAVNYGHTCREFSYNENNNKWNCIFSKEEKQLVVQSDYLIIATGSSPKTPFPNALKSPRSYHVNEYNSIPFPSKLGKILVVGGGQSGAEAMNNLIEKYRNNSGLHITWATRDSCFRSLDIGVFSREFYSDAFAGQFFALPESGRSRILFENRYAGQGISHQTAEHLYKNLYDISVFPEQRPKVELLAGVEINSTNEDGLIQMRDSWREEHKECRYDLVIYCTGFEDKSKYFIQKCLGVEDISVARDYSIISSNIPPSSLFVQTMCTSSHGLGQPNYVVAAQRSANIINAIFSKKIFSSSMEDCFVRY